MRSFSTWRGFRPDITTSMQSAQPGCLCYLTRIDCHNGASNSTFGAVHSGIRVQVIACDLDSFPGGRIEIRCRKGIFHFMSLGFHASALPCDATSFVRSDNIYGNPSSLSGARLKTNLQEVSPEQVCAT